MPRRRSEIFGPDLRRRQIAREEVARTRAKLERRRQQQELLQQQQQQQR